MTCKHCWDPGGSAMAGVTLLGGGDMVLGFACGLLAAVTGGALADCAGIMSEVCWDPGGGAMTGVALLGGGDMVLGFACGLLAVVTGGALARNLCQIMLKGRRGPG